MTPKGALALQLDQAQINVELAKKNSAKRLVTCE